MEDRMTRVIEALCNDVSNSKLQNNEKTALLKLLEKLLVYYQNQYNELEKAKYDYNAYNKRKSLLVSIMTDFVVTINDTIEGKNDAFCITNMIYKEINYDDKKGKFKRKRLFR